MKKSLLALAVLAASGAAMAQSSTTLSGMIHVGVVDTGAAGDKATVTSLGGGVNAININTSENLGKGLTGGFSSQIRFNGATGDRNSAGTGSALFHIANAYLTSGMGTVRVGKILEANNCSYDPWLCRGGAALMAGTGQSALIASLTQANSVSYRTPTIQGFSAGFQTTLTTRANERTVFDVSYNQGPISAQFIQTNNSINTAGDTAYSVSNVTASPAKAWSVKDEKGKGTFIGAAYDFKVARVAVFNAKTDDAAGVTTSDILGVSATAPMGKSMTLLAGYLNDRKAADTKDTKMAVGVNYALSNRTHLGADVFKAEGLTAVSGSGTSGTGFVVRMGHQF